jgi:hypothetical protein
MARRTQPPDKGKAKALTARRRARIVLGVTPSSRTITPKPLRKPKHKTPLDTESD